MNYSMPSRVYLQQQAEVVVNDMLPFLDVEPQVQQSQFQWLTLNMPIEARNLAKTRLNHMGFSIN